MVQKLRPSQMSMEDMRRELVTDHGMSQFEVGVVLDKILNSSVPDGLDSVMHEYNMKNGEELTRAGELLMMLAARNK